MAAGRPRKWAQNLAHARQTLGKGDDELVLRGPPPAVTPDEERPAPCGQRAAHPLQLVPGVHRAAIHAATSVSVVPTASGPGNNSSAGTESRFTQKVG